MSRVGSKLVLLFLMGEGGGGNNHPPKRNLIEQILTPKFSFLFVFIKVIRNGQGSTSPSFPTRVCLQASKALTANKNKDCYIAEVNLKKL